MSRPAALPPKPWATTGARGRPRNIVNSLYIYPPDLEMVNLRIQARYDLAAQRETRCAAENLEDADCAVVAYGTAARVAITAIERARAKGLPVGLLRPISLYPFPTKEVADICRRLKAILVVELSLGQFVEDVRLAAAGGCPVEFFGRSGGVVVTPAELLEEIERLFEDAEG